MKVRVGFVSNSSTSSFVAVGFNLKDTGMEDKEIFEVLGCDFKEKYENFDRKDSYTYEEFVNDYFWEMIEETGFQYLNNSEDGVEDGDKIIDIVRRKRVKFIIKI